MNNRLREIFELAEGGDDDIALQVASEIALMTKGPHYMSDAALKIAVIPEPEAAHAVEQLIVPNASPASEEELDILAAEAAF